jgi:hypothetical protein
MVFKRATQNERKFFLGQFFILLTGRDAHEVVC